MVKKKQQTKKRKPKGKRLSEALREREAARRDEGEDAPEPVAEPYEAGGESHGPLDSEPPPRWDGEDADEPAAASDSADDEAEAGLYDAPADGDFDDEELEDDDGEAASEGGDDDGEAASEGGDDGDDGDDNEAGDDEDDEWEDDDEDAAAQMGHRRYVISGFFALWCVVGYISGQALAMVWSWIAAKDWAYQKLPQLGALPHEGELVSRASVSLVAGGIIAGIVVGRYYIRPDIRTWADEVAEELSKVKWPNRKEIGNHTVVVIVASIVLTIYLTLLDRFWGFVTNLIYSSGA